MHLITIMIGGIGEDQEMLVAKNIKKVVKIDLKNTERRKMTSNITLHSLEFLLCEIPC